MKHSGIEKIEVAKPLIPQHFIETFARFMIVLSFRPAGEILNAGWCVQSSRFFALLGM